MKIKTGTTITFIIPSIGYMAKGNEKDLCILMFIATLSG